MGLTQPQMPRLWQQLEYDQAMLVALKRQVPSHVRKALGVPNNPALSTYTCLFPMSRPPAGRSPALTT